VREEVPDRAAEHVPAEEAEMSFGAAIKQAHAPFCVECIERVDEAVENRGKAGVGGPAVHGQSLRSSKSPAARDGFASAQVYNREVGEKKPGSGGL
jgi:hypothetical protein